MTTIPFPSESSSYPVIVGDVRLGGILFFLEEKEFSRVFIISDSNVWKYHAKLFEGLGEVKIIPAGEENKNLQAWQECLEWLLEKGADRKSIVLGIGGGVISDLTGFVSACYMRGIRYATVATTLLAQVDAALGGKTGVDLTGGKNLVGCFHHPIAVWCDARFLETLPDEEYRNGMAECIKYAFILMPSLIDVLLDASGVLRTRANDALDSLITKCVSLKASVVAEDPRETTGLRAILNFGHTVGHAIETCLNYVGIKHGEAIMIGMVAEAEIGSRLGLTPPLARVKLEELADIWKLPTRMKKSIDVEAALQIMLRDKKSERNSLNMSLLTDVGRCELIKDVSTEVAKDVLEELREE